MNSSLAKVQETEMAEYSGLTMVTSPAEALRRVQELQAFVKMVMVHGMDYGVIPGTDKPSLFQPGAQKLAEIYGFAHTFQDVTVTEDWDKPFFLYRKRCVLTLRSDGRFIGDGIGSCNSREDRYAWRWIWDPPTGVDAALVKTRKTKSGKTQWRVPNDDIFSLVNTVEKMACKRALIHAVIGATRSAGIFTQDVEDLPQEVFGSAEEHRSWERDVEESEADRANEYAARLEAVSAYAEALSLHAEVRASNLSAPVKDKLLAEIKKRGLELKPKAPPAEKPAPTSDVNGSVE